MKINKGSGVMGIASISYIQKIIKKNADIQDLSFGMSAFHNFLYFNSNSIISHLNQFSAMYIFFKDKSFVTDTFVIKTEDFLSIKDIEAVKKINDKEVMFIDISGELHSVDIVDNLLLDGKDIRNNYNSLNDFYNDMYQKIFVDKKWKPIDLEYKFYRLYKKYFVDMKSYENDDKYFFNIELKDAKIRHVIVKDLYQ